MSLSQPREPIGGNCFHPSGKLVEFPIEDVETSTPERFEKMASLHSNKIAVQTENEKITYHELNIAANRIARRILDCVHTPICNRCAIHFKLIVVSGRSRRAMTLR